MRCTKGVFRLLTLALIVATRAVGSTQIEVIDVNLVKAPGLGIKLVPRGSGVMVSGVRGLFNAPLELILDIFRSRRAQAPIAVTAFDMATCS
jgi:hypothetical protein